MSKQKERDPIQFEDLQLLIMQFDEAWEGVSDAVKNNKTPDPNADDLANRPFWALFSTADLLKKYQKSDKALAKEFQNKRPGFWENYEALMTIGNVKRHREAFDNKKPK